MGRWSDAWRSNFFHPGCCCGFLGGEAGAAAVRDEDAAVEAAKRGADVEAEVGRVRVEVEGTSVREEVEAGRAGRVELEAEVDGVNLRTADLNRREAAEPHVLAASRDGRRSVRRRKVVRRRQGSTHVRRRGLASSCSVQPRSPSGFSSSPWRAPSASSSAHAPVPEQA